MCAQYKINATVSVVTTMAATRPNNNFHVGGPVNMTTYRLHPEVHFMALLMLKSIF
jgi:hypothetical protein